MAKVTKEAAATAEEAVTTNVSATMEDLYAMFSPEEAAEMLALTGQAASMRENVPVLKVNYCTLADKEGRTIKEGNYVLYQNTNIVEVEVTDEDGEKTKENRVENIGIDLGKIPKVKLYCFGTKYSFFPSKDSKDKGNEHICQSQLVFDDRIEKHVGSKLKFECRGGQCPRRAKDAKKADKCGAQWVLFMDVAISEEESVKAIMYTKGSSYIPFSDFVKSLGGYACFFAPVKLSTKQEISDEGMPYYVQTFAILKDKQYPALEAKANFETAKQTRAAAEDFKKAQASRKPSAQLAAPGEGKGAKQIGNDVPFPTDDDNIEF